MLCFVVAPAVTCCCVLWRKKRVYICPGLSISWGSRLDEAGILDDAEADTATEHSPTSASVESSTTHNLLGKDTDETKQESNATLTKTILNNATTNGQQMPVAGQNTRTTQV